MMSPNQVIDRATSMGITLNADGDRLLVTPADKVSSDLRMELIGCKNEILNILKSKTLSRFNIPSITLYTVDADESTKNPRINTLSSTETPVSTSKESSTTEPRRLIAPDGESGWYLGRSDGTSREPTPEERHALCCGTATRQDNPAIQAVSPLPPASEPTEAEPVNILAGALALKEALGFAIHLLPSLPLPPVLACVVESTGRHLCLDFSPTPRPLSTTDGPSFDIGEIGELQRAIALHWPTHVSNYCLHKISSPGWRLAFRGEPTAKVDTSMTVAVFLARLGLGLRHIEVRP